MYYCRGDNQMKADAVMLENLLNKGSYKILIHKEKQTRTGWYQGKQTFFVKKIYETRICF